MFGFGITFEDLYRRDGLIRLDALFIDELRLHHTELHNRLVAARAQPEALEEKAHSQLILDIAPALEDFIAALFGIEQEVLALSAEHQRLAPLFTCKRLFVQRRAAKAYKEDEIKLLAEAPAAPDFPLPETITHITEWELAFATQVMQWLTEEAAHKETLDMAAKYAAWALYHPEGKSRHRSGLLFRQPRKLDPQHLVPVETEIRDGVTMLKLSDHHLRARDGFALTDQGGNLAQALDEAHYCIYCHNQGKDSCSKGMREKDGGFKKSALDVPLNGCPLEEKISEMNFLKAEGVPVGALAVVVIDNPMCAGTGHRICNDCMKSCIYQKQEPVNIPMQETRTLDDVLRLPYGFEIYSLLTRWNPLNIHRPLPRADTGGKVVVVGLGPAGYTLSHHLLNDGHTVVAVDGLKIEPLSIPFEPIQNINTLLENLDTRTLAGFGGVAEYGITVRWNKNYLKIIRLLLERREQFRLFGGVRFGGTLTYDSAFQLGFDHIALCMGAGKPTVLDIPNGLARGVRAASDFLMSLQLSGAAKRDSIANLQLRLPVVVIGGGLTGIDTATEALAYYVVQVEKFLARYETLAAEQGEAHVRSRWSEEEREIAGEFIAHGQAIRAEREQAARENRAPFFMPLLKAWGGATLAYRKRLVDAPSYRLNHEEVEKALEEGIFFAEGLEPSAFDVDRYGHVNAIRFTTGQTLPARAVLIAAGTSPNTVLAREDAEHFAMDGKYFRAVDEDGNPVSPERNAKPGVPQVLMSVENDRRAVSFFGDLHPSYAGNVVKAMGSAKQGYPVVSAMLAKRSGQRPAASDQNGFLENMEKKLTATVYAVNRLTPTIVEVVIHAPLAAEAFEPGQFYRLQNFEAYARRTENTVLAMEGLAMTGAWVDREQGLVSVIALEMGGSSDLCAYLQPGEPVVLMGPTGTPTEIPEGETVLLAGGGLGNAVLFSIGKALRARGSRVLYFAGYKHMRDRYKVEEIEAAADVIIWCSDEGPGFSPNPARPQDRSFVGNIVEAMAWYGEQELGNRNRESENDDVSPFPVSRFPISLAVITRIIAIGSDRMMAAVARARHGVLKPYLPACHVAVGSINSPMQCMMKEICAQCLQEHIDPETGKKTVVFSCFNQDQALDQVSWPHLNERLKQNALGEKLTVQWLDRALRLK